MANPISIFCPENTWKKVATNVTIGQVKRLSNLPSKYLEMYKMTGQNAPSGKSKGVPIFLQNNYEGISSSSAIDVYIMAIGGNGKVRVDLP
jgi:hypothetical protein